MIAAAAPATLTRRIEDRRGQAGMACFIFTEGMLFVMLFFSYFYLGHGAPHWAAEPPTLALPLTMLAVLLASSVTLHWGERRIDEGRSLAARLAVAVTIVLGLSFLAIQAVEFRERLQEVRPDTDAYGSMFYLITSVHAVHVVLGLLMLLYVLMLPRIGRNDKPPHQPLRSAAMYWHFVDLVWIAIVGFLYVMPNVTR
jgi:cytochrome c oxidase subunit 3